MDIPIAVEPLGKGAGPPASLEMPTGSLEQEDAVILEVAAFLCSEGSNSQGSR